MNDDFKSMQNNKSSKDTAESGRVNIADNNPPKNNPPVIKNDINSQKTQEVETQNKNNEPGANAQPTVEGEKKELLKIGVPGFDDLIDLGGIPKGISVLLSGGPGSGKTTFSLQTLNYGAENGEKCLYLSFEESVERLKGHMKSYGWDPDGLEEKGLLMLKRMDPFEISRSVEALLAKARGELLIEIDEVEGLVPKGFDPDRIVLDSLSAVAAAFAGKEEGYRIYIEQLFKALESIGATTFLITEINMDMNVFSRSGIEEFLSDGVFAFYNIRRGNIRVSATEIVKLRGASHKKKIAPFAISTGKGIEVYPTEEIFTSE